LKEEDYQLWGGGVSTGLISSKVFFEGPIIENKLSIIGAALEHSYLEGYPIDVETMVDSISREGVSQSYMNLEPRLGLNFSLNNQWSLKASFNNLSQYMHLISMRPHPLP